MNYEATRTEQSSSRNILVTTPERWDETCFLVPLVRAMAGSGLGIAVLCDERRQGLWRAIPGLEVLAIPPITKTAAIARQLGAHWKIALLWEPGWQTDAVRRAGITNRVGPNEPKLRKHLSDPIALGETHQAHRVDRFLRIGEQLGLDTRRAEWFAPLELAVEVREKHVLLAPDSDYGSNHEWPVEKWAEGALELQKEGYELAVVVPNGGRGLSKQLIERAGARPTAIEQFDESLPILAEFPLLVAADGSLPHLAALAGSTCVTLFGPNDASWRRPLGTRHVVVRKAVECAPCGLDKCPMDLRCQNELKTESVLKAVRTALAR